MIAAAPALRANERSARAGDAILAPAARHTRLAADGERGYSYPMCRNIKTLFNFDPPATDEEVRAASLQFVRKLAGFTAPSKANEAVFQRAVDETSRAAHRLLESLVTTAAARDRETEAAKAKANSFRRFGQKPAQR